VNGGATLRLECKVLNRRRNRATTTDKPTYAHRPPRATMLQLCGMHITRWPYFANDNSAFFRRYIAFPAESVAKNQGLFAFPSWLRESRLYSSRFPRYSPKHFGDGIDLGCFFPITEKNHLRKSRIDDLLHAPSALRRSSRIMTNAGCNANALESLSMHRGVFCMRFSVCSSGRPPRRDSRTFYAISTRNRISRSIG